MSLSYTIKKEKIGSSISISLQFNADDLPTDCLSLEQAGREIMNDLGCSFMKEGLSKFDIEDPQIKVDNMTYYKKEKTSQTYETTFGKIRLERSTYQNSGGGKTVCPLEESARTVLCSTPAYAKMVSHMAALMPMGQVVNVIKKEFGVPISKEYVSNISDKIGELVKKK